MKKLFTLLVLLITTLGYSQGQGFINYKSYKINGGDGSCGPQHPDTTEKWDTMFDHTNNTCTELTHEGIDTALNGLTWTWSTMLPRHANQWFGWDIQGYFVPPTSGIYSFQISSDDRSDFWFDTDGDGVMEDSNAGFGNGTRVVQFNVTAGQPYPFRVRYEQGAGGASLYLKWKSPEDEAAGANYAFNSNSIWSYNPETYVEPLHYDVNFKFGNGIDPSTFSVNTHYRVSENQTAQNENTTSIGLDGWGEATITSQIDETLVGQGKYDITATPGNVEWVVIYSPMVTNKYKYRIGLDVREFPSGVDLDDINNIELLDLVDTDGTSTAFESTFNNSWATTTSDQYWNNFNFYIWNPIPFSSSNYSSSIRSASGYHALKVELNFTEVTAYKTQYVVFDSPSTSELESTVDDVFTVSDVYLAFKELANSGIGMNEGGNEYQYGIQYAHSDLNRDGVFNFEDTFMMMDFLNGGTLFDASYLATVMKLTKTSEYNSISSTNWNTHMVTRTMYPLNLNTTDKNYDIDVTVSWLGDVNLSHSPTPTNNLSVTGKSSVIKKTNKEETYKVDGILDIQLVNNTIEVTLKVNPKQEILKGTQFRLSFDDSILTFDKIITTAKGTPFHSKRTSYINFGSIINNVGTLDGTTEYKLIFNSSEELTSILGLVSLTKTEVISESGEQMKVYIK